MTACVLLSITVALASALAFVSYVFILSLTGFGRDVLASIAQDAAEAVQLGLHGQAEARLGTPTGWSLTLCDIGRAWRRLAGQKSVLRASDSCPAWTAA